MCCASRRSRSTTHSPMCSPRSTLPGAGPCARESIRDPHCRRGPHRRAARAFCWQRRGHAGRTVRERAPIRVSVPRRLGPIHQSGAGRSRHPRAAKRPACSRMSSQRCCPCAAGSFTDENGDTLVSALRAAAQRSDLFGLAASAQPSPDRGRRPPARRAAAFPASASKRPISPREWRCIRDLRA